MSYLEKAFFCMRYGPFFKDNSVGDGISYCQTQIPLDQHCNPNVSREAPVMSRVKGLSVISSIKPEVLDTQILFISSQ